jgi:TP901 family phage tail tape measure protein
METKTSIIIEAIDKASAQIKGVQNSMTGMTTSATSAGKSFDTLTAKAEAASTKFKTVGEKFQQLNTTMTQFAVAGGVALAGLGMIINKYEDFAESMAKVQMRTNATAEEMKKVKESIEGIDTFKGWDEMGAGLASLSADLGNVNAAVSMLPAVSYLAAAGFDSITNAAEIVTQAIDAFGLSVQDVTSVTDVLAIAANKPHTSLVELGSALKEIGPTASALGIKFNDLISLFTALSTKGQSTSQSASSLRMIFQTLLDPSTEVQTNLKNTGVELENVRTATGGISFSALVQEFEAAGAGADDLAKIFGSRAFGTFATLMEAGSEKLKELDKEFQNAAGSAQKLSEKVGETDYAKISELTKALSKIAIDFGPSAVRAIEGLTSAVKPMIEMLNGLDTATGGLSAKVLAIAAVVGIFAGGITKIIGLGSKLVPLILTMGKGFVSVSVSAATALANSAAAFTGIGVGATAATVSVGALATGFGLLTIAVAEFIAIGIGIWKVTEALIAMSEADAAKKMSEDYAKVTDTLMDFENQAKGASGYIGLIAKEMQKADASLTRNEAIKKILAGDVPTSIMIDLGLEGTRFESELMKFVDSPSEYIKGEKVNLLQEWRGLQGIVSEPVKIDKLIEINPSALGDIEKFKIELQEKLKWSDIVIINDEERQKVISNLKQIATDFERSGNEIPDALNKALESIEAGNWSGVFDYIAQLQSNLKNIKPVIINTLVDVKDTGLEKFITFKTDLESQLEEINLIANDFNLSVNIDDKTKLEYSKIFAKEELIKRLGDLALVVREKGLEIPDEINAIGEKIDPERWKAFLSELNGATSDGISDIKKTVAKGLTDVTDIFNSLNIDISGLGDLSGLEEQIAESLKMEKLQSALESWAKIFKDRGEQIPKELIAMAQKIDLDILTDSTYKAISNTRTQLDRLKTDLQGTVNSLQPKPSSIPQLNVIGSKIQQIRVEFFMKLNSEEFLKDWGKLGWSMQNNLKNALQYGV